ncbi:hypothetical protein J8F10_34530 [Gemmata sp. G18]|uniref:Uncharacterized protein n=1 Tax=Gemmata palustris TaxID=2822762 RepID=A0ABS5C318_9BACT|nr:hypothetical protein [Gemmata palustris]MBP3960374.1 hypothetical protein [Gemmata palustris]
MEQFDFHGLELMRLPRGPIVCGRCGDAEFAIGSVFTELHCSHIERRGTLHGSECVELSLEAEVCLRVVEINAYSQLIERLYPGCTAGILFDGSGLDQLARIDFASDARMGRYWSLWGQRSGSGAPNCGTFAYPQPGTITPEFLTSTVISLAKAIHSDCAFDRMPILADALQDAGCQDADILNHCREQGRHSRICYVLNRILGHL